MRAQANDGVASNSSPRPLRVLHVILSLEIGGMEQVVAQLIRNLDQERFLPMVACLTSRGAIAEELTAAGIPIFIIGRMTPLLSFLYPAELVGIMKKHSIDVLHTHSGCWHKAAIAARICGVGKVIYTEHGRTFPDRRRLILLDRLYAPCTDHVVAVSGELHRYMRDGVGISAGKITTILNGVDPALFAPAVTPQPDISCRLGIIARLAPVKDIVTLLRALAEVRKVYPAVTLSVAGDGPERVHLEQSVAELGLDGAVSFLGFRRDMVEVMKSIDIFVLSSLSEGTSITLLEAMASGKPVVVTDVGGNPALVREGENGFLVPSGNPSAMAAALIRLMGDRQLRVRMSAANLKTVEENYSIKAMTAAYECLYEGTQ